MNVLTLNSAKLKQLCASNEVKSLFAFGSVTTEQFSPDSDIDFVVDIADTNPLTYSDKYFEIKSQLEELFNRRIDLLEQKAIRNPYLKAQIDQTKVLVWGK